MLNFIVQALFAVALAVMNWLGWLEMDWVALWISFPFALILNLFAFATWPWPKDWSQLGTRLFLPFILAMASEFFLWRAVGLLSLPGLLFSLVAGIGAQLCILVFALFAFADLVRFLTYTRNQVQGQATAGNVSPLSLTEMVFQFMNRWQISRPWIIKVDGAEVFLEMVREESRWTSVYPAMIKTFFVSLAIGGVAGLGIALLLYFGQTLSDLEAFLVGQKTVEFAWPLLIVVPTIIGIPWEVYVFFTEEWSRRHDRFVCTTDLTVNPRAQMHLAHATVYLAPGPTEAMRGAQLSSPGEVPGTENKSWFGRQVDAIVLRFWGIQDILFSTNLFGIRFSMKGIENAFETWERVNEIARRARRRGHFKDIADRMVAEAKLRGKVAQGAWVTGADDADRILAAYNELSPGNAFEIDIWNVPAGYYGPNVSLAGVPGIRLVTSGSGAAVTTTNIAAPVADTYADFDS